MNCGYNATFCTLTMPYRVIFKMYRTKQFTNPKKNALLTASLALVDKRRLILWKEVRYIKDNLCTVYWRGALYRRHQNIWIGVEKASKSLTWFCFLIGLLEHPKKCCTICTNDNSARNMASERTQWSSQAKHCHAYLTSRTVWHFFHVGNSLCFIISYKV